MTYKRLYGDKLKEFLKSAPLGKISKADRKVMEKKARRWAWEQVQALQARDTVVPPPGYAEMGKTEKVFPVQQMKAFAKEQLDELREVTLIVTLTLTLTSLSSLPLSLSHTHIHTHTHTLTHSPDGAQDSQFRAEGAPRAAGSAALQDAGASAVRHDGSLATG